MVFIMKSIIFLMVLALAKSLTAFPRNLQHYGESFLQKDAYEPKNPSEETQQIMLNVESYVSPINDPNLRWGIPLIPFIPYKGINELNEINSLKGHTQFTGPAPFIPHIQQHEDETYQKHPFYGHHHFQGHQLGPLLGGGHHGQSQIQHFQTGHIGGQQFHTPQHISQSYFDKEEPHHPHQLTSGFGGHHQFQGHGSGPHYQTQHYQTQQQQSIASDESGAHDYVQQQGLGNMYQKGSGYTNLHQESAGRPDRVPRPGRPNKFVRPAGVQSHHKLQTKHDYYDELEEPKRVVEASKVKQVAKEVARVVQDGGDEKDVEQAVSRFLKAHGFITIPGSDNTARLR